MSAQLASVTNAYGDLDVIGALPSSVSAFESFVSPLLSSHTRGIWLRVPCEPAFGGVLSRAIELGFRAHHAHGNVITLQAWRSPARNPTPAYGHHAVGAGALVVNAAGHILAIREKFDTSGGRPRRCIT